MSNLPDIDFQPLNSAIGMKFIDVKWEPELISSVMHWFKILCEANFIYYRCTMSIIELRGLEHIDMKSVYEYEKSARRVSEVRAKCKKFINFMISIYYDKQIEEKILWHSDDVVCDIGSLMDKMCVQYIKGLHFKSIGQDNKFDLTLDIAARTSIYFSHKLIEVRDKGYYECIEDYRTYDLEGIDD